MSGETDRAPASPLSADDRRLIRLVGRMPLVSASNLAPMLAVGERQMRSWLRRLQHSGWLASMNVGMIERRQDRWFITSQAVQAVYVLSREPEAGERMPWTATSRGIRTSLRRLSSLEMLYQVAPALPHSGWLRAPVSDSGVRAELELTDLRLLRNGGWFHAVAHYGENIWVTFTYVGVHATERSLRRKRAHRFWGLDVYASKYDAYELAVDRVFYENPRHEATPSAQIVLAADDWAAQLVQREFARSTRPLICTPEGRWNDPVELLASADRAWDPVVTASVGRAEQQARWRKSNRDVIALCDPLAYVAFMATAQFPAMRHQDLSRTVGVPQAAVGEALVRLVDTGLVHCFDDYHYLTERGMRRVANLSRLLPSALIRRHGAYLSGTFRDRQLRHDIGVNRLVVQFASEGAAAFAGWRGEINVPGVTQIRPDLVVLVSDGPLGAGAYCLEYERSATAPAEVIDKIRPYRKCAAVGRPVPLLMVCETEAAAERFAEYDSLLPLLVTHTAAVEAGRLTGDDTVWRQRGAETVSLHCRR